MSGIFDRFRRRSGDSPQGEYGEIEMDRFGPHGLAMPDGFGASKNWPRELDGSRFGSRLGGYYKSEYRGKSAGTFGPLIDPFDLPGAGVPPDLAKLLLSVLDRLSGAGVREQVEYDQEIYDQCKAVGDYLHDEEVPNLLLLDRSARPAHVGIRQYMRMRYPDNALPSVYFVDPQAALDTHYKREVSRLAKDTVSLMLASRSQDAPLGLGMDSYDSRMARQLDNLTIKLIRSSRDGYATSPDVVEDFRSKQPVLSQATSEPVMIFDTCTHTGETMHLATSLMRDAGFTDVRTGVVSTHESIEEFSDYDLVVTTSKPSQGCYPFGDELGVCRETSELVAERSPKSDDHTHGYQNRQSIKAAIIRYAAFDPDIPVDQ